MAEHLTPQQLRTVLREREYNLGKFEILRSISCLLSGSDQSTVQELVLRLLECQRQGDFPGYESMIDAFVRQLGLFPYLDQKDLSLSDSIAYEFHKPTGLEDEVVFHRAQALVYFELMSGANVILSAPTSFGKSLIIDSIISSGKYNNIAIVLPTIALIDETRRRLWKYNDSYKIITHASQKIMDKNIFVLTQERVVEFLPEQFIDFFIIDEFYKVNPTEQDQERSYILNQALYKLLKSAKQFYMLGPNIERINNVFADELNVKFIRTDYKTVVSEVIRINEQDDAAALVELCSNLHEPTMIYCASPPSVNRVVKLLIGSGVLPKRKGLTDAIDWLEENYHPDWILPVAMKYGIGVHHGKIPRAISQYAVRAFNEEQLQFLVCTSTLIEGVNTKAKNVIIYDNKIARRKFDYFTFNNICGRSGRMFQHFVGKVFIFHDPPAAQLPEVDFPILSQGEDVPDRLLLQLDEGDLTQTSKEKLKKYDDQDILSLETLKLNSTIEPQDQIGLALNIVDDPYHYHQQLYWKGLPKYDQLVTACELIWNYFVKSRAKIYGVSSGKQLAFKLQRFAMSKGNIKSLIDNETRYVNDPDTINEKIEELLDFSRFWVNYNFPKYLMALNNIQEDVFKKLQRLPGNYTYYASQVECMFTDSTLIALDEYGIPLQVSVKIAEYLKPDGNLDQVLANIKKLDLKKITNLTPFEKEFIEEVQSYI